MVWVCCGFSAAGQQLVLKYGVGVLWFQCGRTATCFEVWCGCVVVSVQQDNDLVLKYGVGVLWFQCGRTATCFEVWCGCVVVSVRQDSNLF